MRMKDCQIVLAVAELKSFTKAADKLHLSQPAVSLAIKRFEDSFGERIFERQGSQVKLTPSGDKIIGAVQKIHDIFESVLHGGLPNSHLRIGLSSLLSGLSVATMMERLRRLGRKSVDFEFIDSDAIFERSDLDVAIFVQSGAVMSENCFGLDVRWIGCDNGVLIRSKKERGMWDTAARCLRQGGLQAERVVEVNDCFHAYQLAADGVGFTPCVFAGPSRFTDKVLSRMPPLPSVSFALAADDRIVGNVIRGALGLALPLAVAV